MCGRFTLTEIDVGRLMETFVLDGPPPDLPPRYNIAPTQPVATVVREVEGGPNRLAIMRWGLIPSWAKDPAIGSRMINARAETLPEKPSFRAAFSRRRCLVIADGFYEWQAQPGGPKVPMYITLQDRQPFGFAGLWERWTEPESGAALETCTIITTAANALIAPVHDRMPVILPRESYDDWLNPALKDRLYLMSLLAPYPAEQMIAYPVSRKVNNAAYDAPDLIERAG